MFKLNDNFFSKEKYEYDSLMVKKDSKSLKYYKNQQLEESLIYDFTEELNFSNQVYICGYNIDTSGIYAFIQILLSKNMNEYDFIKIEKKELLNKSTNQAVELCIQKLKMFIEKQDEIEYNYIGSTTNEDNLYVFVEIIGKPDTQILKDMCLIDEIINSRSNCDIKINERVTEFFVSNISMFLLYDEENKPIEIPSVMFLSRESVGVQFTRSIEMGKGTAFSIFGPHYYFTNYANVKKEWNDELLRFAVFTGKQLVKLNYPEDPIDISRIKKDRLKEKEDVRKYEMLTMRLTDYDSLWSESYDSVYIGDPKLDDDSNMKKTHICCIKDKTRCVLLSSYMK
jgi:hypothetical protein